MQDGANGSQDEEHVPEFYIDAFNFVGSAYTVQLQFLRGSPEREQAIPVVSIRMSPTHAKAMAILLKRLMKIYEEQSDTEIALPPSILQQHDIDLERDW